MREHETLAFLDCLVCTVQDFQTEGGESEYLVRCCC